jgi:hypothetical protein
MTPSPTHRLRWFLLACPYVITAIGIEAALVLRDSLDLAEDLVFGYTYPSILAIYGVGLLAIALVICLAPTSRRRKGTAAGMLVVYVARSLVQPILSFLPLPYPGYQAMFYLWVVQEILGSVMVLAGWFILRERPRSAYWLLIPLVVFQAVKYLVIFFVSLKTHGLQYDPYALPELHCVSVLITVAFAWLGAAVAAVRRSRVATQAPQDRLSVAPDPVSGCEQSP